MALRKTGWGLEAVLGIIACSKERHSALAWTKHLLWTDRYFPMKPLSAIGDQAAQDKGPPELSLQMSNSASIGNDYVAGANDPACWLGRVGG